VIAEKPPIIIRNDTVEFNAGSFKTAPNSVVEDLLKQLPGMEVDKDGNITVNGKKVTKITVDGKDFFAGDPKIATRNLPKDIVDKIQVADNRTKEAIFNNTSDGNEDKAINITLKKDKKKGMFGRVTAGYGSSERYEGGGNLNYFNKGRQISLIANANNTNRQNFSGGDVNVSNARSSFGNNGGGITRSGSGGINFSEEFGKKLHINGSYFYNNYNGQNSTLSKRQNIRADTSFFYNSDNRNNSTNNNHRFNINMNYRIDSLTQLNFNSYISTNRGRSVNNNESFSETPDGKLINTSNNIYDSRNSGKNSSGDLFLSRRFKKRGRGISLGINFNNNDQSTVNSNIGENAFYNPNGDVQEDTVNQRSTSNNKGNNISLSLVYSEPLSKTLTLQIRNQYSNSSNTSDRVTNDYNPLTGKYEIEDSLLTNAFRNTNESYMPGVSLQFVKKKLRAGIGNGIRFLRQDNYSITGDSLMRQRYTNFFPNAHLGYGFSKASNLNINYNGSTQQPSIQQLQPITDNRNPLYIRLGNPDLQPSFTHNLNFNLQFQQMATQSFWSVNGNFSTTSNQIVNETRFDSINRQISRPINTDGNYYSGLNITYGRSWKRKNWSFSMNISTNANQSRNTAFIDGIKNNSLSYGIGERIGFSYTWKEIVTVAPNYGIRYNTTSYSIQQQQDPEYINKNFSFDVFFHWPKRLVIENNIQNSYNSRTAPGFRKSVTMWNAAINYQLFKKKQGNVRLAIYDILKQNTSVYRNISSNYIEDVQTQVLQQYFLLSFSYNLKRF
jgi:hypothetical protein